tara:strand:+ start:163 stop:339 length:177 start_codon:yes stop_codon:yes gene_type:complete
MLLAQLERLQKDSSDLELYALKLKKRGRIQQMENILKKRDYVREKIKLIKSPEVQYST